MKSRCKAKVAAPRKGADNAIHGRPKPDGKSRQTRRGQGSDAGAVTGRNSRSNRADTAGVVAGKSPESALHGRVPRAVTQAADGRQVDQLLADISAAAGALRGLVEFSAECGDRPAILSAIVHSVDDQVAIMLAARDEIADRIGVEKHQCQATICSSRWRSRQEAAGTDAGGTERQRSRRK